jgi:hypothetical protein
MGSHNMKIVSIAMSKKKAHAKSRLRRHGSFKAMALKETPTADPGIDR